MNKYGDLVTTHSDITGLAGGKSSEGKGDQIKGSAAPAARPSTPPAPPMGKK